MAEKEEKLLHEHLLDAIIDLQKRMFPIDLKKSPDSWVAKQLGISSLQQICRSLEQAKLAPRHIADIKERLGKTIEYIYVITDRDKYDEYDDMFIRILQSCAIRLGERFEEARHDEARKSEQVDQSGIAP